MFYYSISQKVITLSGSPIGRFITLSGVYYIIGRFFLHYRARITVSGVYYIIGWYTLHYACSVSEPLADAIQCNKTDTDFSTGERSIVPEEEALYGPM